MPEILATLAIIGVLAAAASPAFVRQIRDGRVQSAATSFADLVRTGRARALGRGSAVLLRWNNGAALPSPTNGSGHLVMREAVQGDTAARAPLPTGGCLGTDWATDVEDWDPGTSLFQNPSQHLGAFDERTSQFAPSLATFFNPSNASVTYAEICFSARGRSFIRYANSGPFTPLAGVPRIQVTNTETTFARQVVIPPNGAARVISRL